LVNQKQKKCNKGWECGKSCITRTKQCKIKTSQASKANLAEMTKKITSKKPKKQTSLADQLGTKLSEGLYGEVFISKDKKHIIKRFKTEMEALGGRETDMKMVNMFADKGLAARIISQGRDKDGFYYQKQEFLNGYKTITDTVAEKPELKEKMFNMKKEMMNIVIANGYTHLDPNENNFMYDSKTDTLKMIDLDHVYPIVQ
jgi:hypothetical protein